MTESEIKALDNCIQRVIYWRGKSNCYYFQLSHWTSFQPRYFSEEISKFIWHYAGCLVSYIKYGQWRLIQSRDLPRQKWTQSGEILGWNQVQMASHGKQRETRTRGMGEKELEVMTAKQFSGCKGVGKVSSIRDVNFTVEILEEEQFFIWRVLSRGGIPIACRLDVFCLAYRVFFFNCTLYHYIKFCQKYIKVEKHFLT